MQYAQNLYQFFFINLFQITLDYTFHIFSPHLRRFIIRAATLLKEALPVTHTTVA